MRIDGTAFQNAKSDQSASIPASKAPSVMPAFTGFGLYWAWVWLIFFTATVVPLDSRSLAEANALRCLGFISQAIAFLVLVIDLVGKDPLVFRRGVDNSIACILGVVGTVSIIAGSEMMGSAGLAICAAGFILWGVAGAFLTFTWGRILDSLSTVDICFYLAVALVLGTPVAFAVTLMPSVLARAATVLLPVASMLLGHRAKGVIRSDAFRDKVPPAPVTDPKIIPAQLLRILFGVFAYSIVLGLVLGMVICQGEGGFDSANRTALASPLIAGLAIAAIARLRGKTQALAPLHRLCMPAIVAGLLLLADSSEPTRIAACALIVMGFQVFDVILMVVLFDGSRHYQNLSIRAFLMGRFANVTGLALGWAFGAATVSGAFGSSLDPDSLCLAAVGCLVTVTAVTLLERDLFPRTSNVSDPAPGAPSCDPEFQALPDPDEQLRLLAARHGLSPQETRVFIFLAKGYSRKTIQEKLFIASATVDTHISHIYRKMGIHSRQELINIAEEALS